MDHDHSAHESTTTVGPHPPGHGDADSGGGSHAGHEGGSGGHMMMSMAFHVGVSETVLFNGWKTSDETTMFGSCVIIFFLAICYEGLKYFRESLYKRHASQSARKLTITTSNGSTEALQVQASGQTCCQAMFTVAHMVQTLLHALQFFISYLLMLIFMTYNVWLCLAVILGATVGFFTFGWRKTAAVDITEHCQ